MCDLISAVQWEDVGSRELGRSKGHSLSHELLKSSEDEHEVPSLSQQQWAESATVTTEGLYSVKHIKNSSFVSPLDPRGGYDGSVVFSGAAASLHVLIRRGCPFLHPRAGQACASHPKSASGAACARWVCALPLLSSDALFSPF